MKPIRVVSWDVDGTLYSIGRMKWQLLRLAARRAVCGRLEEFAELQNLARYRASIDRARSKGGALESSLWRNGRPGRRGLLDVERRWHGPAIRRAGPRAGVTELLTTVAARGLLQVVLSDYRARYKLEALGLEDRFDSTYEGECMGYVKPSPVGFQRIASDYGIPVESLLHIGDRADTDRVGSRAAGCRCLILGQDFRSFDVLLESFGSFLR